MPMLPDLLHTFVTSAMNVVLLFLLIPPKYGKRSVFFVMLAVLLSDTACAAWSVLIEDYSGLTRFSLFKFILIGAIVKTVAEGNLMRWFFGFVAAMDLYAAIALSSNYLQQFLPWPLYANTALRITMYAAIICLFRARPGAHYRRLAERWSASPAVFLLLCANLAYFIAATYSLIYDGYGTFTPHLLMIIAVNICFIVMFRKFETLSAEYAAREEALKRDCTLELLRAELAYCSKTEEASREKWHDLRHHNAVVLEYMNAGETENAKRYLKEYDDGLVAESPTLFCKNPTANAALRIYSRRAKALGAAFSVAADIPEELPVPDPEFGVLLSNLLENACAACENCEAGARFISVLSRTDRGQLLLEIRNRVSGETIFNEGMPRSGKKSGGIGAKSASGIAAKHGGMLRFLREGTEFRVQMVLPLDTQGMHTDEAV